MECLQNLEKFSLDQVRLIIEEEIEKTSNKLIESNLSNDEIDNLIKKANNFDIEIYEKMDIDDPPKETLSNNNNLVNKQEDNANEKINIFNLNEKYEFIKNSNLYKEIEFTSENKNIKLKNILKVLTII